MENLKVRFASSPNSEFYNTLKQRVDQYFKDKNAGRQANWKMVFKTVFFITCMLSSYALILSNLFSPWAMLGWAMFFGLSSAFFVFNVAHDASHGAYSSNAKVNKLLSYTWNLVGISSHMWHLKHNIAHHNYTNVAGSDMDIEQGFFLRFHRMAKKRSFHSFQHLYAPILYGLFSIYLIFIKDFQMYRFKKFGNKTITGHANKEYVILIVSKLFYAFYNLVIPAIFLSLAWWQILIGFVMMHMVIGNVMAFILTPVHITDGTKFEEPDERGLVNGSWAIHQIESTIDMSPDSKLINFFAGGLNTHVAHHVFPSICHIHYFDLTKIIKETATEFGIEYKQKSLFSAMLAHLIFLKDLGKYDVPPLRKKLAA